MARKKATSTPGPKPVGLETLSKWTPDMIAVGMTLKYRGDQVPFVSSDYLINKGRKRGDTFLLPSFVTLPGSSRKWTDVPGDPNDIYVVVGVETGRVGKTGNPLADLVIIQGDGYTKGTKFGLHPDDVVAKFAPITGGDQVIADLDHLAHETGTELEERLNWKKAMADDAW